MQGGGLAAPTGTQQHTKFSVFNVQEKAGYRLYLAKIFTHILQHNSCQPDTSMNEIKEDKKQMSEDSEILRLQIALLCAPCPMPATYNSQLTICNTQPG
jgi:hypothetical protein